MTDIILTSAKYLIIILFAYFTYISFRAQRDVPDEKKKTSFALQRITMFLIHALAFLVICINIQLYEEVALELGPTLALYGGQFLYLVVMCWVIPHIVSLSKGLHNVMCMFLVIGFIIQTRLNFDTSVRQFVIVAVSTLIFLAFVFLCKRAKFLRNLTWIYCIVSMGLLLLVLLLASVVKGAKLAINLGFFSFQPAEFVKILFVLFVASAFYKATNRKMVLITALIAAVHVMILVFCHDLGSALILFVIYVMMLYAATKKLLYVGISVGALAAASIAAYHLFSHVQIRIATWLNPWTDIDNTGYQITQSLFAIGTGGWLGSGIFGGKPQTVPMVSNDLVFSAISEEMGGLFSLLLILLCLCFTLMIFRVALRVNNTFYKLVAFGLGTAYAFQVFLTIGGTIKFIPLTGVNLPFISNGGSSLLASFIMLGMIQALYVISEADVEREREMIAAGAPIEAFEGYETPARERKTDAGAEERRKNERRERMQTGALSHDLQEDQKSRIRQVDPDQMQTGALSYDLQEDQKSRIRQVDPDQMQTGAMEHDLPAEQRAREDVLRRQNGIERPDSRNGQRARIHQIEPEAMEERTGAARRRTEMTEPDLRKEQRSRIRQVDPDTLADVRYGNGSRSGDEGPAMYETQRSRIQQVDPEERNRNKNSYRRKS